MTLKSGLAGAIGTAAIVVCNVLWAQALTPQQQQQFQQQQLLQLQQQQQLQLLQQQRPAPSGYSSIPPPVLPAQPSVVPQTNSAAAVTGFVPAPAATSAQTYAPGTVVGPQAPAPAVAAPPVVDSQFVQTSLINDVPVFGQILFQGAFAYQSFQGFNPDYQVTVDDIIDVRLWGAYTVEARLGVDSQGNVFVPSVGPVHVANVRNADLNAVVEAAVKRKYRENVSVYASLAATQPVKVFVSGFVRRPGLYGASASDSVLRFLDLAGGVDPFSGSYLNVRVLRNGVELAKINLYDFLLAGKLPQLQLRDGDSIFVGALNSTAKVRGLVAIPARYEFDGTLPLTKLLAMSGANPSATHVRITHNAGDSRRAEYLLLSEDLSHVQVQPGDELELVADRQIGEIIIQVEGEHLGRGQYVLPYNATLKDLLAKLEFSPQSLKEGLQLYRLSIALRQKQVLNDTLDKLEAAIYSARSTTTDEAQLRTQEAALIDKFVERARTVQPKGQLILSAEADPARIPLEDGDVIQIPRANPTVAVHGEVYFPSSFVRDGSLELKDYLDKAGGLTQNGDVDKILVLHPDGEIIAATHSFWGDKPSLRDGDEILVLPKVDRKTFQFSKDIIEILYQTAVVAGVALRF